MNRSFAWALIGIAVIAIIAFFVFNGPKTSVPSGTDTNPDTQSISDGTVAVSFPPSDFGLATNDTQVLVKSYIPPCTSGFGYCLYYIGSAYTGSNFESAGLRIQKRPDLSAEATCLNTPPSGFDSSTMPTASKSADAYSASRFADVGDAGAGHYAVGSLYRLFVRASSSCYEFETRIGETQFANYPAGTIKEFTSADQAAVTAKLNSILATLTLPSGVTVVFP